MTTTRGKRKNADTSLKAEGKDKDKGKMKQGVLDMKKLERAEAEDKAGKRLEEEHLDVGVSTGGDGTKDLPIEEPQALSELPDIETLNTADLDKMFDDVDKEKQGQDDRQEVADGRSQQPIDQQSNDPESRREELTIPEARKSTRSKLVPKNQTPTPEKKQTRLSASIPTASAIAMEKGASPSKKTLERGVTSKTHKHITPATSPAALALATNKRKSASPASKPKVASSAKPKPRERFGDEQAEPLEEREAENAFDKAVDKEKEHRDLDAIEPEEVEYVDLASSSDVSELLEKLRKVNRILENVPQGKADPTVRKMIKELGSDSFIKHGSAELRLLVACCLAHVFRVFAPDPPYPKRTEKLVFDLFIRQLGGLEHPSAPFFIWYTKLLDTLVLVQAFVLIRDNEEMIVELIHCIFQVCVPEHSHKTIDMLKRIVFGVLDELNGNYSQPILDALLAPLADSSSEYRAEAKMLASSILLERENLLLSPVSSMLSNILVEGKSVVSELAESMEVLLQSLSKVSSDYLMYLAPDLERDLMLEDPEIRSRCVSRVGNLLCTGDDRMVQAYPSLFKSFLKRSSDADASIRVKVCNYLGQLIEACVQQRSDTIEALCPRMHDIDEGVRYAALEASFKNAYVMEDQLKELVVSRLLDKKDKVRQLVWSSFVKLFRASNAWMTKRYTAGSGAKRQRDSGEDSPHEENNMQDEEYEEPKEEEEDWMSLLKFYRSKAIRFDWIPQELLMAYKTIRHADSPTYIFAHSMFQELIDSVRSSDLSPGKKSDALSVEQRVVNFTWILSLLDPTGKVVLESIVSSRKLAARELGHYLEARDNVRAKRNVEEKREAHAGMVAAVKRLARAFPEQEAVTQINAKPTSRSATNASRQTEQLLKELSEITDLKVFRKLKIVSEPSSTIPEIRTAAEDAVQRVGSKSALGDFLHSIVIPKCSPSIFGADHVKFACELLGQGSKVRKTEADSLVWILETGSKHFPSSFDPASNAIYRLFCETLSDERPAAQGIGGRQQQLASCVVQMLSSCGDRMDFSPKEALAVRAKLKELVESSSNAHEAKLATRALCRMLGDDSSLDIWKSTFSKLIALAMPHGPDSPEGAYTVAPIISLSELAKHVPHVFSTFCEWDLFHRFCEIMEEDPMEGWRPWLVVADDGSTTATRKTSKRSRRSSSTSKSPRMGQSKVVYQDPEDDGGDSVTRAAGKETPVWMHDVAVASFRFCAYFITNKLDNLLGNGIKDKHHPEMQELRQNALRLMQNYVAVTLTEGDILNWYAMDLDTENGDAEKQAEHEQSMQAAKMENEQCADVRLYAAVCALKMCRRIELHACFTAEMILQILLVAQDALPEIRARFASKLFRNISKKKLPTYFMCGLVFMTVDPQKDNQERAKAFCSSIVRNVREAVRKRHGTDDKLMFQPEAVLPYLIWFLAHHPDRVMYEGNSIGYCRQYLSSYFDVLIESRDYTSYLMQIMESILLHGDALSPETTPHLHAVAREGLDVLRAKNTGRIWDLTEYVGQIPLPPTMYKRRKDEKRRLEEQIVTAPKELLVSTARALDADIDPTAAMTGVDVVDAAAAAASNQSKAATLSETDDTHRAVKVSPVPPKRRALSTKDGNALSAAPSAALGRHTTPAKMAISHVSPSNEANQRNQSKRKRQYDVLNEDELSPPRKQPAAVTVGAASTMDSEQEAEGNKENAGVEKRSKEASAAPKSNPATPKEAEIPRATRRSTRLSSS